MFATMKAGTRRPGISEVLEIPHSEIEAAPHQPNVALSVDDMTMVAATLNP